MLFDSGMTFMANINIRPLSQMTLCKTLKSAIIKYRTHLSTYPFPEIEMRAMIR